MHDFLILGHRLHITFSLKSSIEHFWVHFDRPSKSYRVTVSTKYCKIGFLFGFIHPYVFNQVRIRPPHKINKAWNYGEVETKYIINWFKNDLFQKKNRIFFDLIEQTVKITQTQISCKKSTLSSLFIFQPSKDHVISHSFRHLFSVYQFSVQPELPLISTS